MSGSSLSPTTALVAGATLALAQATPTLPATFDVFDVPIQTTPRDYLLLGSLALLVLALAARIYRRHHADAPTVEGPDLRWWKNS